jgi:hypothetical protein
MDNQESHRFGGSRPWQSLADMAGPQNAVKSKEIHAVMLYQGVKRGKGIAGGVAEPDRVL